MDLGVLPAAIDLLGRTQDDPVPGFYLVEGDPSEVPQLGFVDVGSELDVDAPKPPTMRELNCKVASTLARSPSANPALAAEDAGEVDQPVIPVVASRNGKKLRSSPRDARQCRPVRTEQAILVLRGLGHRIH